MLSSEEIINLRSIKPETGDQRDAISIPEVLDGSDNNEGAVEAMDSSQTDQEGKLADEPEFHDAKTGETPEEEPTTETREEATEPAKDDDDSTDAVGKEEAAKQDRDMLDDDNGEEEKETIEVDPADSKNVSTMFKKILSLGGQGGQVVIKVGEEDTVDPKGKLQLVNIVVK